MKKSNVSFTALGIIFGAGIGIISSLLIDSNITLFIIPSALGLIIGAIIDGYKKAN